MTSIRAEVTNLQGQGVNKIIALGHAGFSVDKRIAREVAGVDVVVGGHTNTFLYTGNQQHQTMVFCWGHSRSRASPFYIESFLMKTTNVTEIYWF